MKASEQAPQVRSFVSGKVNQCIPLYRNPIRRLKLSSHQSQQAVRCPQTLC